MSRFFCISFFKYVFRNQVLNYVISQGKMRFVKIIMGIECDKENKEFRKLSVQNAIEHRLHEDLQLYFIELPADKFINKPEALQQILRRGIGMFREDVQRRIFRLPENQFVNKQAALFHMVKSNLSKVSEDIQQYIIGLPADQFVNKQSALQCFLERPGIFVKSIIRESPGLHQRIIGLPADLFVNKPLALQQLLSVSGLIDYPDDIQKHIIGIPADQFVNKPDALKQFFKHLSLLSKDIQKYIIGLSADQFVNKPVALQRLLKRHVREPTEQLDALQLLLKCPRNELSEDIHNHIIGLPGYPFVNKQ